MALIYLNDIRLNAEISGPADGAGLVLIHALGTRLEFVGRTGSAAAEILAYPAL